MADVTNTVTDAARTTSVALSDELVDALATTARDVVRGAERLVPVRTGAARKSLGVEVADRAAMIVAGGTTAPYFHILEYGSKFVKGGHYIGRAAGAQIDDLEKAVLVAVEDAARRGGFGVG